jgi:hypothetical protein
MRVGEGIRNALIVLILIACAHVWIQRHQTDQTISARICKDTVRPVQTLYAPPVPRQSPPPPRVTRQFIDSWPEPPEEIEWANSRGPSPQKQYTTEDEEREALHRLVFAGADRQRLPHSDTLPKLLPDYSGLHMAAEQSCQLPMFDIAPKGGRPNTDSISGIESWGAGYAAL